MEQQMASDIFAIFCIFGILLFASVGFIGVIVITGRIEKSRENIADSFFRDANRK